MTVLVKFHHSLLTICKMKLQLILLAVLLCSMVVSETNGSTVITDGPPVLRRKRDAITAIFDGMKFSDEFSKGDLLHGICTFFRVLDDLLTPDSNIILKFPTNVMLWLCGTLRLNGDL